MHRKVITLLLLVLLMFCFKNIFAQHTVTILISSLENSKGSVFLELRNSDDIIVAGYSSDIYNNACKIVIDSIPDGEYTFRYFHDENNNQELDTGFLGIPKEGFGFSNNAKGKCGPPKKEKTIFTIFNDTTLTVSPIYY